MNDDDDIKDPTDKDLENDDSDDAKADDHEIPSAGEVKQGQEEEDQFSEPVASPSVTGEESIAGDAPTGEPQDIDQSLADMGLGNDDGGAKPLSSDDIDY